MRQIHLPYGHGALTLAVPEEKLLGVFEPRLLPPAPDPAEAVRAALRDPIQAPRLRDAAKGARRVAITVEDATRPVPNALLLEAVMEELQAAATDPAHVIVIVATGLHRGLTSSEMDASLGRWKGKLRIENHDPRDPAGLIRLGKTTLGTEIQVNRAFMEADFKILTGDVEYHQFVGYGGGVKSVYPGLADAAAIEMNHSRMDLPGTGPGRIDGNPAREEIDEAGRMAGVNYLLTVVLDPSRRVVEAHAGHPDRAFRRACATVDRMYRVEAPSPADLVIASPGGHPKDIDLYQSQKAMEEATHVVRRGGNVLTFAACPEGSGSALFETWMEEAHSPEDVIARIRERFVMGGHKAYQIAREVQRANLHLYSQLPPGKVRSWMMRPVRDLKEAQRLIDEASAIAVLPQATLVHMVLDMSSAERLMALRATQKG